MGKLPVSVVVPFTESRRDFFEGFVLPMIEANRPEEIIIIEGEGSAGHKRNKGAKQARGKYILFCDDDNILKKKSLKTHVDVLEIHNDAAFSYSNFAIINLHPDCYPQFKNLPIKTFEWDPEKLKKGNYIDTCSLIRASHFLGFDETLPSLEDWDLWLTMSEKGMKGKYIDECLFFSFHIDKSLSYRVPIQESAKLVLEKHKINHPSIYQSNG